MNDSPSRRVVITGLGLVSPLGNSKEALSALKSAVEYGGDPIRKKARADSRFSSIRNTWTFKRYVKSR